MRVWDARQLHHSNLSSLAIKEGANWDISRPITVCQVHSLTHWSWSWKQEKGNRAEEEEKRVLNYSSRAEQQGTQGGRLQTSTGTAAMCEAQVPCPCL